MSTRLVFFVLSCALLLAACTRDEPTHWIASAKGHIAEGDLNSATVELKTALQLNGDLPEARYLLAETYLKAGDVAAAEKEFIRARELAHSPAKINPPLARIGVEKGEFQQVIRDYS